MTKNIQQNLVKPLLTTKEKRRYHQISESFFKGAGDFFVLYNESINKSVDNDIIKGQFMQYYEDAIKSVKNNIKDKIDGLFSKSVKDKFYNQLLNFIIVLEMGVIASVKLPLDFSKIKNTTSLFFDELDYIKHILKDGTIDGINYITESFSSNFRVDAAIDEVLKNFEPFVYYAYENLVYGLDYLLNNTEYNPFLMWLNDLAKACGSAASGLVGLILQLFGLSGYTAAAKRPNLMHFLRYGTNPYRMAQRYEEDIQKTVEDAQDTSSWWEIFSSNSPIGYKHTDGEWDGLDDDDDGNELPEVKKLLNNFQSYRLDAAKNSNQKYKANSIFVEPDIFDTKGYQDMSDLFENTFEKLFELGSGYQVQFNKLDFNSSMLTEQYREQLQKNLSIVGNFYTTNRKSNKHPYVEKICDEIDKYKLLNNKEGTYTIEQIIFLPVILYAIIQYEHTQKRDIELIRSYDQRLRETNAASIMKKTSYGSEEFQSITKDYNNGLVSTESFIKKLSEILFFINDMGAVKRIVLDDILCSFGDFYNSLMIVKQKVKDSLMYLQYGSSPENYTFKSLTTASSKGENGETVYEQEEETQVNWKSLDDVLGEIKINHAYLKLNIRSALVRRQTLCEQFNEIINFLNPINLYPELLNYDA